MKTVEAETERPTRNGKNSVLSFFLKQEPGSVLEWRGQQWPQRKRWRAACEAHGMKMPESLFYDPKPL